MIESAADPPAEVVPPVVVFKDEPLGASVQLLPLPAGLYLVSVKAAGAASAPGDGRLALPAMHLGLGPGVRPEQVEFMAGPSTHGAWLFAASDLLVIKVLDGGAALILTSVRATGGAALSIKVERLNARAHTADAAQTAHAPENADAVHTAHAPQTADAVHSARLAQASHASGTVAANAPATAQAATPAAPPRLPVPDQGRPPPGASLFDTAGGELPLAVRIGAHIRARGDMIFADVPWAGRVAPGLWIESFSVRPLQGFGPADIEYKALTGSGFETPWVSDAEMCGTKGMAVPLLGFALRLKPSAATAPYDCEYSGYFQSGATVGPLLNGAPCRSTVANDPLEGIQVRLLRRTERHDPPAARAAGRGGPSRQRLLSRGA